MIFEVDSDFHRRTGKRSSSFRPEQENLRAIKKSPCHSDRSRSERDGAAEEPAFLRATPHSFNVSLNAVESWEQGIRHPREVTLKLLTIAHKHPEVLLSVE